MKNYTVIILTLILGIIIYSAIPQPVEASWLSKAWNKWKDSSLITRILVSPLITPITCPILGPAGCDPVLPVILPEIIKEKQKPKSSPSATPTYKPYKPPSYKYQYTPTQKYQYTPTQKKEEEKPKPGKVDIKINNSDEPVGIFYNASTTLSLSWTSANTTSCTASGAWKGSKDVSGQESINIEKASASLAYGLICKDKEGKNVSDSVNATVTRRFNDAILVSDAIPLILNAGDEYDASITFKNIGSKNWTKSDGYALKTLNDAIYFLESGSKIDLEENENIATDQTKTFDFRLRALTTAGTYNLGWMMEKNGGKFGEELSKNVEIVPAAQCPVSKVDYGTVALYPDCSITCNKEYILVKNSCLIETSALASRIKSLQEEIQKKTDEIQLLLTLIQADPQNPEAPAALEIITKSLNELVAELQNLQSQVSSAVFLFARILSFGSQGDDVRELQKLLAKDKEVYPESLITGYFDSLTQKAVQRFQCKYNIVCSGTPSTTGYGVVGPKTRERLNALILEQ